MSNVTALQCQVCCALQEGWPSAFKCASRSYGLQLLLAVPLSSLQIYPDHNTMDVQPAAAAGMITSMDDFYILSRSHLVVTETSNDILDPDVWQQVVPQAALSWQRVLVANWLSSSGKEWAHWIKQHNSGVRGLHV